MKKDLRIVFMGTPDFAVETLKSLLDHDFNVVGVITAPDKPAGRGRKLRQSAVKEFAVANGLTVLQPVKFKNEEFLTELKNLNANLQVVVAFRMLPEVVWNMPEYGTFNLHASLLPQYRGAAPINWAIINGEKQTGITTFFIEKEIDTGNIIDQVTIDIEPNESAGTLHDKLMIKGAELVANTVKKIEEGNVTTIDQEDLFKTTDELKPAPKIFKEDCEINFDDNINNIYNKIRGLSPYPCAWIKLTRENGEETNMKVYEATIIDENSNTTAIKTDGKDYIHIETKTGTLALLDIQLAGKKRMKTADFLRGNKIDDLMLA